VQYILNIEPLRNIVLLEKHIAFFENIWRWTFTAI